jgi:serine phosphatase RsbU (regulator of sigma subunit)
VRKYFVIVFLFLGINVIAQELINIDSLYQITTSSQNDTIRAEAHMKIGMELSSIGSYDESFEHHQNALELYKKANNSIGISKSLNSLGVVSRGKGDYSTAMDYYFESLKICEKGENKKGQAIALSNIGVVYMRQKDFDKALDYFNKALVIDKETKNLVGEAYDYGNIAILYSNLKQKDSALYYNRMGEKMLLEAGDEKALIQTYNVIGGLFLEENQFDSALFYYDLGLKIANKLNLKEQQVLSSVSTAQVYWRSGKNVDKAMVLCKNALVKAEELGNKRMIQNACDCISISAELNGDFKMAYDYYIKVVQLDKQIYNLQNDKKFARIEMQHEYSKKEAELLAEKKREQEISVEKQKRQQTIIISVGFVLILVVIFFLILLRRFKVIKEQKQVIEIKEREAQDQKTLVEEKNKEITDSIQYAKRIQSAILPPDKVVKEYLKESFILYKPKDIVAGDFYWMENIKSEESRVMSDENPIFNTQHSQLVLFAAADCTGHGVPGAMVSVVCNNALNRSVREYGLTDPGEILDKTRELVIEEFEKSDEEVKDGMDIALCSLENNKLKYAGANNPLWIIRNGEIIETKANKQPIGKFDNPLTFTSHSFDLQKGDSIYIFSDGFVDQFGGEKGKKFKAKALRKLLLSIQDKEMEEQRTIIDNTFESWKGNLEQIDDVCVIGVRI